MYSNKEHLDSMTDAVVSMNASWAPFVAFLLK